MRSKLLTSAVAAALTAGALVLGSGTAAADVWNIPFPGGTVAVDTTTGAYTWTGFGQTGTGNAGFNFTFPFGGFNSGPGGTSFQSPLGLFGGFNTDPGGSAFNSPLGLFGGGTTGPGGTTYTGPLGFFGFSF